jgi:large subunit ribosomal protein L5
VKSLREYYQEKVIPELKQDLGVANDLAVTRIEKVVVNMGVGKALDDKGVLEPAARDLKKITGQVPKVCRARRSIAGFGLREGKAIGLKVTLRGEKMWAFLSRLIGVALPRRRDFRGLSRESFDGRGNYTVGIKEQRIFPAIDADELDELRSFEVTIVTTATNDKDGEKLLEYLGFPFREE